MPGEHSGPGVPTPPTPPTNPTPPTQSSSASRNRSFSAGNSNPYQYTDKDFSYMLSKINAPVTPQNLKMMHAWRTAEGAEYSHNPFNTTQPWQGATGSFVKNYKTRQQGLDATIDTLLNAGGRKDPNKAYYRGVVAGFRQNNPDQTMQALVGSPWAGGHYGGLNNWKASSLYRNYYGSSGKSSSSGVSQPAINTQTFDAMPIPAEMPALTQAYTLTTKKRRPKRPRTK